MKQAVLLPMLCLLFACCTFTKNEHLFPIYKNNRVGYIDVEGKVIIPPIFREGGVFSENLAPARKNGLFGYIDRTGEFVIKPAFDFASDFHEGFAIVYKEGRGFFINKSGNAPFPTTNYRALKPFNNGLAIVQTHSERRGAIDTTGKLVIDTLYKFVIPTMANLFIVINRDKNTDQDTSGLMDNRGQTIVPYGQYMEIDEFSEGYARVETFPLPNSSLEETSKVGFIDTLGKLLFLRPQTREAGYLFRPMVEGFAEIMLLKPQFHNQPNLMVSTTMFYSGFINLHGEVVLNDTLIESVREFSNGYASVCYADSGCLLINQKMQRVKDNPLYHAYNFQNGISVASDTAEGYGLIDKNGNFLFEWRFEEIKTLDVPEGCFIFKEDKPTKEDEYRQLHGLINARGEILLESLFENYDQVGFRNGLMSVTIDGKSAYVNPKGHVVWQEKPVDVIEDLNISYQDPGMFYAFSKPHPDDNGGSSRSDNFSQKITDVQSFTSNKISIKVAEDQPTVIDKRWNGYRVFVANTSSIPVFFNASDSRLEMVVQAKHPNSEWKDISFLPSSFCGNSYHTLTLENGEYWAFEVPKYDGDFKTKLRIAVRYVDPDTKAIELRYSKSKMVYSNTFDAAINMSQFWQKPSHSPSNLMDPYAY